MGKTVTDHQLCSVPVGAAPRWQPPARPPAATRHSAALRPLRTASARRRPPARPPACGLPVTGKHEALRDRIDGVMQRHCSSLAQHNAVPVGKRRRGGTHRKHVVRGAALVPAPPPRLARLQRHGGDHAVRARALRPRCHHLCVRGLGARRLLGAEQRLILLALAAGQAEARVS